MFGCIAFFKKEIAEKLGLTYLYSHIAFVDDWNRFKGIYFWEEEMKAMNLMKKDIKEWLKNIRAFRKAQFELGNYGFRFVFV